MSTRSSRARKKFFPRENKKSRGEIAQNIFVGRGNANATVCLRAKCCESVRIKKIKLPANAHEQTVSRQSTKENSACRRVQIVSFFVKKIFRARNFPQKIFENISEIC
jgi:hypothetical protein